MSDKKASGTKNIIGTIFFLLAGLFLVRSFILAQSTDIWYDELFSMEFAGSSVSELVGLTARDVHPPLYYIILRFFLLVFDGVTAQEILAKMASIVPFVVLLIYAITTVRKHFGMLTAGIFSFTIVSMPGLPEYTTEIRMYSYAMWFVTAALLHGFNLIRDYRDSQKGWDIPNGLALWLYSAAAAYTHYYAAVAVGAIMGLILLWMIVVYVIRMREKNSDKGAVNFKALATIVICINFTIVSYIPWLSKLASQVSAVKANYWIQPVGIRTFGSCIKYMFSGYFSNSVVTTVIAVIMFALSFFMGVYSLIKLCRNNEEQSLAFLILPVVVCFGIAVSMLMRPVFVSRYMVPSFGCFWLGVSIFIGRELSLKKCKFLLQAVACAMILFIAIVGCVDYKSFNGNEEYRTVQMNNTLELFGELDTDTIIISNFNHVQALLSYYLNSGEYSESEYSIYLYYAEPEELISETVPGLYSIEDSVDVRNLLQGDRKVLFLGSFNSREDILEEWNQEYGITSENKGSYLMERYWFDVFELSL